MTDAIDAIDAIDMRIDAELSSRQSVLDDLRMAMGELFGAERRLRGREQQQPRDLTHSQLRALRVLALTDEVTAGDLARSADLNPASVTAMLDQLESSAIVQRRRSAHDRRVCMVSLTEKGRGIMDEKHAHWQALWRQHLEGLSEDELSSAGRVMRTITDLLEGL